jgi:hypothetical protein
MLNWLKAAVKVAQGETQEQKNARFAAMTDEEFDRYHKSRHPDMQDWGAFCQTPHAQAFFAQREIRQEAEREVYRAERAWMNPPQPTDTALRAAGMDAMTQFCRIAGDSVWSVKVSEFPRDMDSRVDSGSHVFLVPVHTEKNAVIVRHCGLDGPYLGKLPATHARKWYPLLMDAAAEGVVVVLRMEYEESERTCQVSRMMLDTPIVMPSLPQILETAEPLHA